MNEYFTIMIKENDTSNLKLLTEKLNDGFSIDDRFEVGRSLIITLRKRRPEGNRNYAREMLSTITDSEPTLQGIGSSLTTPF